MKYPKSKGFTLIELLVVVAIIGILATVVLASLGTARSRAKDASIKQSLSGVRAQAELQYLETGNYNTICDASSRSYEMFLYAHARGGVGTGTNICADENNLQSGTSGNSLGNNTTSTQWFGVDANGSFWGMTVKLNSGDEWFCADSLGNAKVTPGPNKPLVSGNKTC